MNKDKFFSSNSLVIGIFTLLAVGSWVAFDVYRGLTKSTVPDVLQEQIRPLDIEFDEEVIDNLQNRRQFNDQFLLTVESKALEEQEQEEGAVELELIRDEDQVEEGDQATSSGTAESSPSAEVN